MNNTLFQKNVDNKAEQNGKTFLIGIVWLTDIRIKKRVFWKYTIS